MSTFSVPARIMTWAPASSDGVPALELLAPHERRPGRAPGFEPVPLSEVPAFEDDLDVDSLRQAIAGSLSFY